MGLHKDHGTRYSVVVVCREAPNEIKQFQQGTAALLSMREDFSGNMIFSRYKDLCIEELLRRRVNPETPYIEIQSDAWNAQDDVDGLKQIRKLPQPMYVRAVCIGEKNATVERFSIDSASHIAVLIRDAEKKRYAFVPADCHPRFPCFYQKVRDSKDANFMTQAVILDSFMFHALGLNKYARSLYERQQISGRKVQFLRDYVNTQQFVEDIPNQNHRHMIGRAAALCTTTTPYVSFFALFSECFAQDRTNTANTDQNSIVEEYVNIWQSFARWYLEKEHRVVYDVHCDDEVLSLRKGFRRYAEQISPHLLKKSIVMHADAYNGDAPLELVLVILKRVPRKNRAYIAIRYLLKRKSLRQNSWIVIKPEEMKKFKKYEWAFEFTYFQISVGR